MSDMAACAAFIRDRVSEWENVALSVPEVEPKSSSAVFTSLHMPTGTVEISPVCVLAQVAAMRAIVDLHPGATDEDECPGCGADLMGRWRTGPGEMCPTLGHLAAIWHWHDQYDPAWAPDT